jgi:hypothetical protein
MPMTLYSTRVRWAELCPLMVADTYSERMVIHIDTASATVTNARGCF